MVTTTAEEESPIRYEIGRYCSQHAPARILSRHRFIKMIAVVAITLGVIFFGLSFLITEGKFRISNLVRCSVCL